MLCIGGILVLLLVNYRIGMMINTSTDIVTLDDEIVEHGSIRPNIVLKLHKPVGVECTCNLRLSGNIVDYLHSRIHMQLKQGTRVQWNNSLLAARLFPIGNLLACVRVFRV